MSSAFKAHLALFSVSLIYGGNYTIAKVVLDQEHIQPLAFILLRVMAGVLLFWSFHALVVRERMRRKDLGRIALCSVFGVAINQMFFFSGLKWTTPINASLIMTTTPILVLVISAILIGERITQRKVLGILLGAAGAILLIAYGEQISFGGKRLLGDLLIFVNASAFGIYLVLVKGLMDRYHPVTVVTWIFSFGLFLVLPFGIQDFTQIKWHTFDWQIWLAVAYVVIGTTFLAYLLNAYALKLVNASLVSVYIYLQPLFASLIALLSGKDSLNSIKVTAACLIFAGVYLVSIQRRRVSA